MTDFEKVQNYRRKCFENVDKAKETCYNQREKCDRNMYFWKEYVKTGGRHPR